MENEKRLIDANSLIEDLELLAKHEEGFQQSVILGVVHTVKARRTVDAVEVVRCRDCKHYDGKWFCKISGVPSRKPCDFCSYGERKEGAD